MDSTRSYEGNIDKYLRRNYGMQSLKEAMEKEFCHSSVKVLKGVSNNAETYEAEIEAALKEAEHSDILILTLGEVTGFGKDATSGEGINNPSLRLPGYQEELVKKLSRLKKPMILILFNGRPLILTEVEKCFSAILEVWYPGTYGPEVIAETLSGKRNPGGKLPITFPRASEQCPVYYGHKAGSGYCDIDYQKIKSVLQPLCPF